MNILFIATFPIIPHEGGVQRVTNTLSKEFIRQGYNVVYLCHARKHKLEYPNFLCPQYYVELVNTTDEQIRDELSDICQKHQITHVINQSCTSETARIIKLLPKEIRFKTISVYHTVPFAADNITRKRIWTSVSHNARQHVFKYASLVSPTIYRRFFNHYEERALRTSFDVSTRFCFITDKFYPLVTDHIPDAPTYKFFAIENPNSFPIQNNVPSWEERENAILWVGRLDAGKNVLGFIKMWEQLSCELLGWSAYIIGEGDESEKCKSFIRKRSINGLHLEGKQTDVAQYYKKCKFLCSTSYSESWGLTLTEAMTFGCVPVVMDTFLSLSRIVDDGKNGLICPANEFEMKERLIHNISCPGLWEMLSKGAVEKAKQFDVSTIAKRWEKELKRL